MDNYIKKIIENIATILEIKSPSFDYDSTLFATDTQMGMLEVNEDCSKAILHIKKGLQINDLIFVIAHELRHLYQIANKIYPQKIKYDGNVVTHNDEFIEIDANAFAMLYVKIVLNVEPLFLGLTKKQVEKIKTRSNELYKDFFGE